MSACHMGHPVVPEKQQTSFTAKAPPEHAIPLTVRSGLTVYERSNHLLLLYARLNGRWALFVE